MSTDVKATGSPEATEAADTLGTLVFTRRRGESVLVGPPGAQVRVTFIKMQGGQARLLFCGPASVPVWREEIAAAAIAAKGAAAKGGGK